MTVASMAHPQLVAELPAGRLSHPVTAGTILEIWRRLALVVPAGAVWSVQPGRP